MVDFAFNPKRYIVTEKHSPRSQYRAGRFAPLHESKEDAEAYKSMFDERGETGPLRVEEYDPKVHDRGRIIRPRRGE